MGTDLDDLLRSALDAGEADYQRTEPGSYLVRLPGEHKLATMCWLVAGRHALTVEAFVMRRPDPADGDVAALHRYLLRRNARLYAVAFSIDAHGDVYLTGRLPLAAVTEAEIDRVLGAVLAAADDHFDELLRIGFGAAIRREWAWRVDRGESLANLAAFRRFADPDHDRPARADPAPG